MSAAVPERSVFHAIADPNRRKILELLKEREQPVQRLVDSIDISFGGVSQHLKILREAGLVTRRKDGRKRIYRLRAEPLKQVHDWTAIYQRAWRQQFRRLHSYLERDK